MPSMVVIVDNVTAKNEKVVMRSSIVTRSLRTINEDLNKIIAQGPWWIYKDLDTSAVDDCLNRLSTAFEKFMVVCPTSGYMTFMV
jgi:hypothetical protein